MVISKSYKNFITKKEYQQLLNYQAIHKYFMDCLEKLELSALEITQEINNDVDSELFLGGLTSSILYSQNEQGLIDGLKFLDIEVEKDIIFENKKEVNKVSKKKFKSGSWARNKSLDVHKEIVDRHEFHDYVNDFVDIIIDNQSLIGRQSIVNIDLNNIIWETKNSVNENNIFDYDNQSEDGNGAMG